jgi:hypothetical protein
MATSSIPVEVEGIVPNAVSHMSRGEIEKLPIFYGNQNAASRTLPFKSLVTLATAGLNGKEISAASTGLAPK